MAFTVCHASGLPQDRGLSTFVDDLSANLNAAQHAAVIHSEIIPGPSDASVSIQTAAAAAVVTDTKTHKVSSAAAASVVTDTKTHKVSSAFVSGEGSWIEVTKAKGKNRKPK